MDRASSWTLRLVRNVLLWLVPMGLVWVLITPFYNRFLETAAGNLLHLVESPNVTRLLPADAHYATVVREDFPPGKSNVYRVRVTDIHFHLWLLGALFLAVPGVGLKRKLSALGVACLIAVFFHLIDLFLWVKFVYATQLGDWSREHYGAFAQNLWGLAKHVMDLPFKLALPLVLWVAFYYRQLTARHRPS